MKKIAGWMALGVLLGVAALFTAPTAKAADMGWPMVNSTQFKVVFQFFSRTRNHVWPGGGQVWYAWPGQRYTPVLRCMDGEYICYGAWVEGNTSIYWGVGPNGTYGCPSCCYTCTHGYMGGHNLTYNPYYR
jgi:hypothetical protein